MRFLMLKTTVLLTRMSQKYHKSWKNHEKPMRFRALSQRYEDRGCGLWRKIYGLWLGFAYCTGLRLRRRSACRVRDWSGILCELGPATVNSQRTTGFFLSETEVKRAKIERKARRRSCKRRRNAIINSKSQQGLITTSPFFNMNGEHLIN